MHKIDGADATLSNTFTDGDPGLGELATEVTADWLNAVQAELVYVIEQAAITLDKPDNTQLLEAIDYHIDQAFIGPQIWDGEKVLDGDSDSVLLRIQGHTSQTLDLFVVEASDGTDIFSVGSSLVKSKQRVYIDGSADICQLSIDGHSTQTTPIFATSLSTGLILFSIDVDVVTAYQRMYIDGSADVTQLSIDGHSTQTQPLLAMGDNLGNSVFVQSIAGLTLYRRQLIAGSADEIQFAVKSHTTQTADHIVVENTGGTDLFRVDRYGSVIAGAIPVAASGYSQGLIGGSVSSNRLFTDSSAFPAVIIAKAGAEAALDVYAEFHRGGTSALSTGTSGGGIRRNAGNSAYEFFNPSDERLKKDITNWDRDALASLCSLPVRVFAWQDPAQVGLVTGWIAQEVLKVIPEAVGKDANGNLNLGTSAFQPYFHRAIQQLNEMLVDLRGRLHSQEEKLTKLAHKN